MHHAVTCAAMERGVVVATMQESFGEKIVGTMPRTTVILKKVDLIGEVLGQHHVSQYREGNRCRRR